jgi:CheY-like chemotaxis protein
METRILIVDDDPFICRQLDELFTSQRYLVATANSGPEAKEALVNPSFPWRLSISRSPEPMA